MSAKKFPTTAIFGFVSFTVAISAHADDWIDDFQTAVTYDRASLLAPLYGGSPTKYTLFAFPIGDISNSRAVSGDGSLTVDHRELDAGTCSGIFCFDLLTRPHVLTVLGWLGLGIGLPGEPPRSESSVQFTTADLCIYGGVQLSHWQARRTGPDVTEVFGPDGQPGIAGVDDDGNGLMDDIGIVGFDDDSDGTTDESGDAPVDRNESPAMRLTTVNGGYGNGPGSGLPDGTGFLAGEDNAPGDAGVDDDANGTIDDHGETGWPGTDDGDDTNGLNEWSMWMRMNLDPVTLLGTGIFLAINPAFTRGGHFQLGYNGGTFAFPLNHAISLEQTNEINVGFYTPNTSYSWQFCARGTCYGAALWAPGNIANPDETLGPYVTTFTTSFSSSNIIAFGNGVTRFNTQVFNRNVFLRRNVWRVNTGFSHKFWVIEGDSQTNYPSVSADLDNDLDVDANDFLTFSNCFNGALNPPKPICLNTQADLDLDGDVDGADFLVFSFCFNGALKRPSCMPVDLMNCPGGGQSAMGGGGSLLAQSAVQSDPFLTDGMTPIEEFWYFYTPTCTGQATLALCDSTGQGRSVDGIHFAFFDGTSEESTVVPAAACGQAATETVPMVVGQTVYLLVYRDEGAESLAGFTLDASCE